MEIIGLSFFNYWWWPPGERLLLHFRERPAGSKQHTHSFGMEIHGPKDRLTAERAGSPQEDSLPSLLMVSGMLWTV